MKYLLNLNEYDDEVSQIKSEDEKQERKILQKQDFKFRQLFVYFSECQRFTFALDQAFHQVLPTLDCISANTSMLVDSLHPTSFIAMSRAKLIDPTNHLEAYYYPQSHSIYLKIAV